MHDWALGTNGKWVSMGIPSDGSYGIKPGIVYGYPVTCANGKYEIVQGLSVNEFSRSRMAATEQELREERAAIEELLKRSEEHTSELQSLMRNSYAVFCLKKKRKKARKQIIKRP